MKKGRYCAPASQLSRLERRWKQQIVVNIQNWGVWEWEGGGGWSNLNSNSDPPSPPPHPGGGEKSQKFCVHFIKRIQDETSAAVYLFVSVCLFVFLSVCVCLYGNSHEEDVYLTKGIVGSDKCSCLSACPPLSSTPACHTLSKDIPQQHTNTDTETRTSEEMRK